MRCFERYKDLTEVMPSYAVLQAEHFPLSKLTTAHLSPLGLIPETRNPPVMSAQANFIEGGLLLAIGVHHSASDASAVDAILDVWAKNTAAACNSIELNFCQLEPQINDRSPLMFGTAGAKMVDFPEYFLQPTVPTALIDGNSNQMARAPSKIQPLTARIFFFSPSSLAALKVEAAAYSTNDALTAFLWRHMTLARNPFSQSKLPADIVGADSAILYAANIRRRTSPPLPQNYLGNAFIAVKTDPLSISTLMSLEGLKIATSTIRKSLHKLADQPNRISLTIGLMDQYDTTELKYAYNGFLGPDIMATSWADVGIYNSVWGDLGKVESFRVPGEGSDGTVAIFPRLKSGGLEVRVALETGAMGRLIANRDFVSKAELWA
jgi:trichothecene 3-O-acetyltransferase